jgi:adenine-specific DNA-methyltransferase
MARVVAIEDIVIPLRQRETIEEGALKMLQDSILSRKGLLHAPVCWWEPSTGKWQLVAGERRLRAIMRISEANLPFVYDSQVMHPGMIPITELADPESIDEAELEENIIRVDLSWSEQAKAVTLIEERRRAKDPTVTQTAIAEELAQAGGIANGPTTTTAITRTMRQSRVVTEFLDDPEVANSRNLTEAYNLVLRKQENAVLTILAERRLAVMGSEVQTIKLVKGDCLTLMPTMDRNLFDCIISDPPYGIGANQAGYSDRTAHQHTYTDSFAQARRILQAILLEGHRLTKPMATLFLFTDYDHFDWLRMQAQAAGWDPWRRPIIWQKSLSEGLRPWGRGGPAMTYDVIFYARKGPRGFPGSPTGDVMYGKRVARDDRLFAAEKPFETLRQLIECGTIKGDYIFDPCAGSGPTLWAARHLSRRAYGIELNQSTYEIAMANLFNQEEEEAKPKPDPADTLV